MPDILRLDDVYLTRLFIDWHGSPAEHASIPPVSPQPAIDYQVLRNPGDPKQFMLELHCRVRKADLGGRAGCELDAKVVGLFDLPESLSEDERQQLIRINGIAILYGYLRGQVGVFSGSFPAGKITLPAIYVPDEIARIETARARKHAREAATPRAAKPISATPPAKPSPRKPAKRN